MKPLPETLKDLGFLDASHDVNGRLSINDIIAREERCGIYVLHCANGELYAGKSINVVRRYTQHIKNHLDVERLSFKCVDPNKLSGEEKRIIYALEKAGFPLRNIVDASVTYTPSAFDEVMSPDEQTRWIDDITYVNLDGERLINTEQRRKYTRKYQRSLELPLAEDFINVLRHYVRTCIPAPIHSEMYYWSCSCLATKTVYARINIYLQEVFTLGVRVEPFFDWHLAKPPHKTRLHQWRTSSSLFLKFKALSSSHYYKSGGQDQYTVGVEGFDNAMKILTDPQILQSIRLFNLRLMRKGVNLNYRSHCFDLADRLLE